MNEAAALIPQRVGGLELDNLLAFVGIPSKRRSVGELSGALEKILKDVAQIVDERLMRVIETRTQEEFANARKEVFGDYLGAVKALSDLVRIVAPSQVIERIAAESFNELEAEFREHGLVRFGDAAKSQATFTIWTLRRTSGLMSKIAIADPVPEKFKDEDAKLASDFAFAAAWCQFHLDCLVAAIRFDKTIQLDVMPSIIDGLRAAVNAYGYARQGLHLRTPEPQPLLTPYSWDEEDQELLDSSMRDMEVQALDD